MSNLKDIFSGLPRPLMTLKEASEFSRSPLNTVYDWRRRPERYDIPIEMFFTNGRKILIRTDIFEKWFISRSA